MLNPWEGMFDDLWGLLQTLAVIVAIGGTVLGVFLAVFLYVVFANVRRLKAPNDPPR